MINELNLSALLARLEAAEYAGNEILVPTLHAADALQAPGGFTHVCLDQNARAQHITR